MAIQILILAGFRFFGTITLNHGVYDAIESVEYAPWRTGKELL